MLAHPEFNRAILPNSRSRSVRHPRSTIQGPRSKVQDPEDKRQERGHRSTHFAPPRTRSPGSQSSINIPPSPRLSLHNIGVQESRRLTSLIHRYSAIVRSLLPISRRTDFPPTSTLLDPRASPDSTVTGVRPIMGPDRASGGAPAMMRVDKVIPTFCPSKVCIP